MKNIINKIKNNRYVAVLVFALLIFIASSSIALFSPKSEDIIEPAPTFVMAEEAVLSDLFIKINNGEEYATSQQVTLHLSAKNADKCRYKNDDDLDWSDWESYKTEKSWKLSDGGDGERIVAYQCKNNEQSEIVFAQVILDQTAPEIHYIPNVINKTIQVKFVFRDIISPSLDCEVIKDGVSEFFKLSLVGTTASHVYITNISSNEHVFKFKCTDKAGNINEQTKTIRIK